MSKTFLDRKVYFFESFILGFMEPVDYSGSQEIQILKKLGNLLSFPKSNEKIRSCTRVYDITFNAENNRVYQFVIMKKYNECFLRFVVWIV